MPEVSCPISGLDTSGTVIKIDRFQVRPIYDHTYNLWLRATGYAVRINFALIILGRDEFSTFIVLYLPTCTAPVT